MSTKVPVLVLAAIILAGGVYYVMGGFGTAGDDESVEMNAVSNVSGMPAEENMVVVSEQRPNTEIIGSLIRLATPGYLVIHEDTNGGPGAILGASALLPAGESSNIVVKLSRMTRNGETLHAMLHFEKGSDASFSQAEDTPVPSRLGDPISGWFEISSDAPENPPVSI